VLEDHRALFPDRVHLALAEAGDVLPVQEYLPLVGTEQPDELLDEDLPTPDDPMMKKTSPSRTSKLTPRKIALSPNDFLTLTKEITEAIGRPGRTGDQSNA
jgi:hypothetical protein